MGKKFLLLLLIVILLAAGLVVFIYLGSDRLLEAYRPKIEAQATDAIGHKIEFNQLGFKLFPTPHFSVGATRVDLGRGALQQVSIESALIYPELLSLFGKEPSLDSVTLKGVRVGLESGIVSNITQVGPFNLNAAGAIVGQNLKANFDIEGEIIDALPFRLEADGFEYDLKAKKALGNDIIAKLCGAELISDLVYNVDSGAGKIEGLGDKFEPGPCLLSLSKLWPSLKAYPISGEIKLSILADFASSALSTLSVKSELSGLEIKGLPVPVNITTGSVNYHLTPGQSKLTGDNLRLVLAENKELLKANFDLNLVNKIGEARISGSNIELLKLAGGSAELKQAISSYRLAGLLSPDLKLSIENWKVKDLSGAVSVESGAADYQGVSIKDISGKVAVGMPDGIVQLRSEGVRLKVGKDNQELSLRGVINPTLRTGKIKLAGDPVSLSGIKETLTLLVPSVSAAKVSGEAAADLEFAFGKQLEINGSLNLSNAGFNAPPHSISGLNGIIAVSSLAGVIKAQGQKISFVYGGEAVKGAVQFLYDVSGIAIKVDDIEALSGMTSGKFTLAAPEFERYTAALNARSLGVDAVRTLLLPKFNKLAGGSISGLDGSFSGVLSDLTMLSGQGSASIIDTVLLGVNIVRAVVDKLSEIPIVGGRIRDRLPREFDRYLESQNTEIRSISGKFSMGGKEVTLSEVNVVGDIFEMNGEGVISADSTLDFKAFFRFERNLSMLLLNKVQELSPLIDRQGLLGLPLTVTGSFDNLSVRPDTSRLAGKVSERLIEQGAQQLIERLLKRQEVK